VNPESDEGNIKQKKLKEKPILTEDGARDFQTFQRSQSWRNFSEDTKSDNFKKKKKNQKYKISLILKNVCFVSIVLRQSW
jgi:hypothetical protein